ncbi:MAG: hypothetical protein OEV43_08665, partial [Coriobacteriia bacterium]|nr:hypothetical protein [Coriobacteriia bacterium]
GGGWWFLSRPLAATFACQPPDATISACGTSTVGCLTAQGLSPGSYEVTVARAGFTTMTSEVQVRRFSDNQFDFTLEPAPQRVSVTAKPKGALCRVVRDDNEILSDKDSVEGTVPAGPVTVEVSLAGYNTITRDLFLDSATELSFVLDPEGQLVRTLGTLDCAGAPKAVAIAPDGSQVWTTILNGPPSIETFDLATLSKTAEIDLGAYGAVEIAFNQQGTRAYASQMETARVFEIDVATHKVLREFDTESAWTKLVLLSPTQKLVFAANWSGDDVSVIDVAEGRLRRRIPAPDTPRGLWATDDNTLYVAGFGDGDLWRVETDSGGWKELFDGNGALRHIVGDNARGKLFISDMSKDVVLVHDISSGKTTTFVETDEKPNTIDLSPDGKVLFVSCRGENNPTSYYLPGPEWGTILLFDATDGTPLDAIVGGNQCTALDVSDDGRLLVFSDFLDDRLRVYEVPTYEELAAGNGGRWKAHFEELEK